MRTREIIATLSRCATLLERKSVIARVKARKDIHTLLEQFLAESAIEDAKPPERFEVRADICTDDENVSGTVDAAEWLQKQSDDDIAYVCNDTGANETTDQLFWWFDSGKGSPWGQSVARRVGTYTGVVDDCGFKVRFNEDDLHIWVQKHKPKAWAIYEKDY